VRIAHISDSHLGCSMFQLSERREDARKCFKKALDMALRKSPDLLVHTGDLFHDSLPQNDDLNFVIKALKEAGDSTDLFVLQGNHDQPYGYRYRHSPLVGLETMGLFTSTGEEPYRVVKREYDGKKAEIHLHSWASSSHLQRVLHDYQPGGNLNLFFAHDIPFEWDSLPVSFDYYGCGHKHTFKLDRENCVGRPGSTCYVNWKTERKGSKKLIVIEADSKGCDFEEETLNDVREFKFVPPVDITRMNAKQAENAIRAKIDEIVPKKKDPIVILEVNGTVDAETEKNMKRTEVIRYGEKKLNPLFLHVEANWVSRVPDEITFSEPLDVERSVDEYMIGTKDERREQVLEKMPIILGGRRG
jgi:DNA repair exonuclease SbcCD nuclease subunit